MANCPAVVGRRLLAMTRMRDLLFRTSFQAMPRPALLCSGSQSTAVRRAVFCIQKCLRLVQTMTQTSSILPSERHFYVAGTTGPLASRKREVNSQVNCTVTPPLSLRSHLECAAGCRYSICGKPSLAAPGRGKEGQVPPALDMTPLPCTLTDEPAAGRHRRRRRHDSAGRRADSRCRRDAIEVSCAAWRGSDGPPAFWACRTRRR